MRVAVLVDHPLRDLSGLILLAMRLCQEQISCHVIPVTFSASDLWALTPDFVLMHHLRDTSQGLVQELQEAGIPVGVLDTEGGIIPDVERHERYLASPAIRSRLTCWMAWGPRYHDLATERHWFRPDQLVLTGHPRFDFYAPCWRQATRAFTRQYAGDMDNFILINGNFGGINCEGRTRAQLVAEIAQREKGDISYLHELLDKEEHAMHAMAALVNQLTTRFPAQQFVYRPHPFERLEPYETLFHKRPNLRVIKAGTVEGWILRARALIQLSCSTGVEAGLGGVPTFTPGWIPTHLQHPWAEMITNRFATPAAMFAALEQVLAGTYQIPTSIRAGIEEVIREWYYRNDGLAHDRIARAVLQHLPTTSRHQRVRACREALYRNCRGRSSWRERVLSRVAQTLRLPPRFSFSKLRVVTPDHSRWDASGKHFNAAQVQQLTCALATVQAQKGINLDPVEVRLATRRLDYSFGYADGRSITVCPPGRAAGTRTAA